MYNDLLCCCYSAFELSVNWRSLPSWSMTSRNGTNKCEQKIASARSKTTNQNNSAIWCTSAMQKRERTQKYSAHIVVFFPKRSNWNIPNAPRIIDLHVFLHFSSSRRMHRSTIQCLLAYEQEN